VTSPRTAGQLEPDVGAWARAARRSRGSRTIWTLSHGAGLLIAMLLTIASSGYALEHHSYDTPAVTILTVLRWVVGAGTVLLAIATTRRSAQQPAWWTLLGWPLTIAVILTLHVLRY
jgi:O-antigen/teichoic acid export membrane protein